MIRAVATALESTHSLCRCVAERTGASLLCICTSTRGVCVPGTSLVLENARHVTVGLTLRIPM